MNFLQVMLYHNQIRRGNIIQGSVRFSRYSLCGPRAQKRLVITNLNARANKLNSYLLFFFISNERFRI